MKVDDKKRIENDGLSLLYALLHNLSDMVVIVDHLGLVLFESASCAKILGYPEGYFINRTLWHVVHPEDQKIAQKEFNEAVLHQQDHLPTVLRCKKADGTWVILEALADNLSNFPLAGGIVITCRDITERWQIQERFRSILYNMDSGYFEVDLRGSFTYFNQALVSFLGYSASEMMGMNYRTFMNPEEAKKIFQIFNQVYRTEEPMKNFYWQFYHKNGAKSHSIASAYLIRDASGAAVGFRGTARNVTEIRLIEEALQEREETFRALTENSRDLIARFDRDYHFLYANPAIKQRMGFLPQDVIGKTNAELGYPESLVNLWQDAMARVFETGKTSRIEYQFVDGAWIDCMFMPEFDADGQVKTVLTASRNMTDYKRLVKSLEESEKRLAEIIDFLPDATAVIDHKGFVTMWNRAMEELSGVQAADIINKDPYEPGRLFYGKGRPTIAHLALERNEDAEKKYIEFTRQGERVYGISHVPDMRGKEAYLWGMAAPLRNGEGNITGAIESVRDITDLKKLEEQLQQTLGELETRVRERTAELEEANTALRVLLRRREEDQANLEERLQFNINELVTPLIEALKAGNKHEKSLNHLNLLETHLRAIASPFLHVLSSVYRNLTPQEIRVVSMIREGKNTKEMAELIGASKLTIEKHRTNIRKKLGLVHGKVNLRTFLLAIK